MAPPCSAHSIRKKRANHENSEFKQISPLNQQSETD